MNGNDLARAAAREFFGWIGVGTAIAFIGALLLGFALATVSHAASCPTPDAVLFPLSKTAGYDFPGADGARLAGALDAEAWGVAYVRVVINLTFGDYNVFLRDKDGCEIAHVMGLALPTISAVFAVADVPRPFGSTYYKLPGSP